MRGTRPGDAGVCCSDCEFVPCKEVYKRGRTLAETQLCRCDALDLYTLPGPLWLGFRRTLQEVAVVMVGEKVGSCKSDGGDLCTTVARFGGGDGGKEGGGLQK